MRPNPSPSTRCPVAEEGSYFYGAGAVDPSMQFAWIRNGAAASDGAGLAGFRRVCTSPPLLPSPTEVRR